MGVYFLLSVLVLSIEQYAAKPVPIEKTICGRFPLVALCRHRRQSGGEDSSKYCNKWKQHYAFYCDGPGKGDQRASQFCPYYTSTCTNRGTEPFVIPPPLPAEVGPGGPVNVNGAGNPSLPLPAPVPTQPISQVQSNVQPQTLFSNPSAVNTGSGGGSFGGQPFGFPGGGTGSYGGFPGAFPGGAPLGFGRGFGVGPFASGGTATNINPFSGVGTGTNINAAGLPISTYRGVNFGGLIPGGLSNLLGK